MLRNVVDSHYSLSPVLLFFMAHIFLYLRLPIKNA